MSESYITLGELWSDSGFCDLPAWMIPPLRAALGTDPPWEPSPSHPVDVYLFQLRRWESPEVPIHWDQIAPPAQLVFLDRRARPTNQTISDIYIGRANQGYKYQVFGEITDGWDYCRFADVVYRGLFFHLSIDYLSDPAEAYRQLWRLTEWIAFAVGHGQRIGTPNERTAMALALYESNRRIAHDIATRQPHYLKYVAERPGLAQSEKDRHIRFFQSANQWFCDRLLAELR